MSNRVTAIFDSIAQPYSDWDEVEGWSGVNHCYTRDICIDQGIEAVMNALSSI